MRIILRDGLDFNGKKEIDVTFTARVMLSIINEVGSLGIISATIGDYGGSNKFKFN